jgi:hypothetical protein
MSTESYRRKAAEFINAAAATDDARRRRALLDEAVYWHTMALEAEANPAFPVPILEIAGLETAVGADAR